MKRITAMLISAIMVLALVGCGADDVKVSNRDNTDTVTTTEASTTDASTNDAKSDDKASNKKDADWWISMGVEVDDGKKNTKTEATTETKTEDKKTTQATTQATTETQKPKTTESTTQATTEAPAHVHTWATRTVTDQDAWDEQICTKDAWDEQILVKDAWDEQVPKYEYKEKVHYYCADCNTELASMEEFCPTCGSGVVYNKVSYDEVLVGYDTIHHDAEYKTVHHDAEYTTKHHDAVTHTETYCTGCGAVQ